MVTNYDFIIDGFNASGKIITFSYSATIDCMPGSRQAIVWWLIVSWQHICTRLE